MNTDKQPRRRWFKKQYVPVVLLVAFVLWGLWPMLAPRWDQDRCTFGEVTNEHYWQMREEVKDDVKVTLSKIRASYRMPLSEFTKSQNVSLKEISKWFPKITPARIERMRTDVKARFIRGVILSKLIQSYTNRAKNNDEKIGYIHAIVREVGGWFVFSQKSSQMKSALYIYNIHSGLLQNSISGWFKGLFERYAAIWIKYSLNTTDSSIYFRNTDLLIEKIEAKNLDDYFKIKASSGCPSSSTFTH